MPQASGGELEAIYCIGNDRVYDWLVALLRSIRVHEGAERTVILIPFDDNVERVRSLADEFNLVVLDDDRLAWLDELGRRLKPDSWVGAHAMRKLIVFFGPADRFLFVDADAVLLAPVGDLFDAIAKGENDFYFLDEDIEEAYRPGPWRDALVAAGARGFNSGIFGSRTGLLTEDEIEGSLDAALEVQCEFVSRYEQSFMNYLVHTSQMRAAAFRDVIPGIGGSWAGLRVRPRTPGFEIADARWRRGQDGRPDRMRFVHWSGYRLEPTMPFRSVYRRYRIGASTRRASMRFEARALLEAFSEPRTLGWVASNAARRLRARIERYPRRRVRR